jgi:hypothetical protein
MDPGTSVEPDGSAPRPEPGWLRWVGLLVACAGAVVVTVLSAFLTPFRIGGFLVPIALVVLVVGLAAVTRFAHVVTGRAGLSLIPGGLWLVLSLVFASRTNEGDLVLSATNWVATVYLFVGSVTVGVLAFRMIIPRR